MRLVVLKINTLSTAVHKVIGALNLALTLVAEITLLAGVSTRATVAGIVFRVNAGVVAKLLPGGATQQAIRASVHPIQTGIFWTARREEHNKKTTTQQRQTEHSLDTLLPASHLAGRLS